MSPSLILCLCVIVLFLLHLVFQQLVQQHTRQLQLSNLRLLQAPEVGPHCLDTILLQGGDFVADLDPEVEPARESHPALGVDDPNEVGVAPTSVTQQYSR